MEYKIPNIPVDEYIENHKHCPYYQKALDAIKKADKSGIVVGADVVSKSFYGVRRRPERCTVGKRTVYLHPVSGVVIQFISQEDVDVKNDRPINWNCKNFVVEQIRPI